jgi:hypothetical protein
VKLEKWALIAEVLGGVAILISLVVRLFLFATWNLLLYLLEEFSIGMKGVGMKGVRVT